MKLTCDYCNTDYETISRFYNQKNICQICTSRIFIEREYIQKLEYEHNILISLVYKLQIEAEKNEFIQGQGLLEEIIETLSKMWRVGDSKSFP